MLVQQQPIHLLVTTCLICDAFFQHLKKRAKYEKKQEQLGCADTLPCCSAPNYFERTTRAGWPRHSQRPPLSSTFWQCSNKVDRAYIHLRNFSGFPLFLLCLSNCWIKAPSELAVNGMNMTYYRSRCALKMIRNTALTLFQEFADSGVGRAFRGVEQARFVHSKRIW